MTKFKVGKTINGKDLPASIIGRPLYEALRVKDKTKSQKVEVVKVDVKNKTITFRGVS